MENAVFSRNMFVRHQSISGVMYLVHQYDLYEINEVGERIWNAINGEITVKSIIDILAEQYPNAEGIAEDVSEFLSDLEQNNLIHSS